MQQQIILQGLYNGFPLVHGFLGDLRTGNTNHLNLEWVHITDIQDTGILNGEIIDDEDTFYFKATNTPNSSGDYGKFPIERGGNSYPAWFKLRFNYAADLWTVNRVKLWAYNSENYSSHVLLYGRTFQTDIFDTPTTTDFYEWEFEARSHLGDYPIPYLTNSRGDPLTYLPIKGITGIAGETKVAGNLCCQIQVKGNADLGITSFSEDRMMIQYDETL